MQPGNFLRSDALSPPTRDAKLLTDTNRMSLGLSGSDDVTIRNTIRDLKFSTVSMKKYEILKGPLSPKMDKIGHFSRGWRMTDCMNVNACVDVLMRPLSKYLRIESVCVFG
jgi:hypothetical protein